MRSALLLAALAQVEAMSTAASGGAIGTSTALAPSKAADSSVPDANPHALKLVQPGWTPVYDPVNEIKTVRCPVALINGCNSNQPYECRKGPKIHECASKLWEDKGECVEQCYHAEYVREIRQMLSKRLEVAMPDDEVGGESDLVAGPSDAAAGESDSGCDCSWADSDACDPQLEDGTMCRKVCCVSFVAPKPELAASVGNEEFSPGMASSAGGRPHIVAVLMDDLGYGDVGWTQGVLDTDSNPIARVARHMEGSAAKTFKFQRAALAAASPTISKLAGEGIDLRRHYAFHQCSPSRRAFLTGRWPLRHGEYLSDEQSDDIDLRWTSVCRKLREAGYECYWYGKMHTGTKSMQHLPVSATQGFKRFVGFVGGVQSYVDPDSMMVDNVPFYNATYSTAIYGENAIATVGSHDPDVPMFMFLSWQSMHGPYDKIPRKLLNLVGEDRECVADSPHDEEFCVYANMLALSDHYMSDLINALKERKMWDNTFFLLASDNGAMKMGSNFPLRGFKFHNWEGGIRSPAFVAGGVIPEKLRGTSSNLVSSLSDWYPTFCELAGIEAADKAEGADYVDIDGVSLWPHLLSETAKSDAAHEYLWVTSQVLIKGDHKLMVSQPNRSLFGEYKEISADPDFQFSVKWQTVVSGPIFMPSDVEECLEKLDGGNSSGQQIACMPYMQHQALGMLDWSSAPKCWRSADQVLNPKPCLYDVANDPSEYLDVAWKNKELVEEMWAKLKKLNEGLDNRGGAAKFLMSRSPDELVGECNEKCSKRYWRENFHDQKNGNAWAPSCGVPACVHAHADGSPNVAMAEHYATEESLGLRVLSAFPRGQASLSPSRMVQS